MLRSPRLTIISLLIFTMGISLSLSRTHSGSSKVKSVDAYWAETGLGPAALEDLLQDNTCGSSERYFIACANAVLNIANRFNMTVTTEGKIVPVDVNMSADMSSEKKQLDVWKEYFTAHTAQAVKLSFMNVWKTLQEKYVKQEQEASGEANASRPEKNQGVAKRGATRGPEVGAQKKLDAETAKLLQQIKEKANKKSFGRKVMDREVIAIGLRQIGPDQIKQLQEVTYSAKDRLHMAHESYCRDHSRISLDDFIGRLMSGQIDLAQKS